MIDFFYKNKRELFYAIILFVTWEMAQIPQVLLHYKYYILLSSVGVLALVSWSVNSYLLFSGRKISKYSEILMRTKFFERFGISFLMPVFLYSFMSLYFYLSKSIFVNQLLIIVSTIMFFVQFIHVRATYTKVFSISRYTRVIMSFIDIIIFFVFLSSISLLGASLEVRIIGVGFISLLLLLNTLVINKQTHLQGFTVLLLSAFLMVVVSLLFISVSSLLFSIVMTLFFYLILSWWSIRLSGYKQLADYMTPLMFTLMGFIIILSL